MARVVKRGVRFTKGNVAVPLCGPSRASILTSMYVHNHGCDTNDTMPTFNGQGLDKDTIGTIFYDTDAKQPKGPSVYFLHTPISKLQERLP